MISKHKKITLALAVTMVLIIAIPLGIMVASADAPPGNAYGKIKNDESKKECIRGCTGINIKSEADEIGVVPGLGDEVVQCLQECGIAVNSGVCSSAEDGCCNPAYMQTDPDCCTDFDGDGFFAEGGDCGPTDCDDSNGAVNPGATEVCNGIDDDCDGLVDDDDPDCIGLTTYYQDADADSYGNAAVSVDSCTALPGYVTDSTDCDDSNTNVNPGATEVSNCIDDDCDGNIDEGCLDFCSGHGWCYHGKCSCYTYWKGEKCNTPAPEHECYFIEDCPDCIANPLGLCFWCEIWNGCAPLTECPSPSICH